MPCDVLKIITAQAPRSGQGGGYFGEPAQERETVGQVMSQMQTMAEADPEIMQGRRKEQLARCNPLTQFSAREFAKMAKEMREAMGMSEEAAAAIFQMDLPWFQDFERGLAMPPFPGIVAFAEVYRQWMEAHGEHVSYDDPIGISFDEMKRQTIEGYLAEQRGQAGSPQAEKANLAGLKAEIDRFNAASPMEKQRLMREAEKDLERLVQHPEDCRFMDGIPKDVVPMLDASMQALIRFQGAAGRKIREGLGLTTAQLAEGTGISEQDIIEQEAGLVLLPLKRAKALGDWMAAYAEDRGKMGN